MIGERLSTLEEKSDDTKSGGGFVSREREHKRPVQPRRGKRQQAENEPGPKTKKIKKKEPTRRKGPKSDIDQIEIKELLDRPVAIKNSSPPSESVIPPVEKPETPSVSASSPVFSTPDPVVAPVETSPVSSSSSPIEQETKLVVAERQVWVQNDGGASLVIVRKTSVHNKKEQYSYILLTRAGEKSREDGVGGAKLRQILLEGGYALVTDETRARSLRKKIAGMEDTVSDVGNRVSEPVQPTETGKQKNIVELPSRKPSDANNAPSVGDEDEKKRRKKPAQVVPLHPDSDPNDAEEIGKTQKDLFVMMQEEMRELLGNANAAVDALGGYALKPELFQRLSQMEERLQKFVTAFETAGTADRRTEILNAIDDLLKNDLKTFISELKGTSSEQKAARGMRRRKETSHKGSFKSNTTAPIGGEGSSDTEANRQKWHTKMAESMARSFEPISVVPSEPEPKPTAPVEEAFDPFDEYKKAVMGEMEEAARRRSAEEKRITTEAKSAKVLEIRDEVESSFAQLKEQYEAAQALSTTLYRILEGYSPHARWQYEQERADIANRLNRLGEGARGFFLRKRDPSISPGSYQKLSDEARRGLEDLAAELSTLETKIRKNLTEPTERLNKKESSVTEVSEGKPVPSAEEPYREYEDAVYEGWEKAPPITNAPEHSRISEDHIAVLRADRDAARAEYIAQERSHRNRWSAVKNVFGTLLGGSPDEDTDVSFYREAYRKKQSELMSAELAMLDQILQGKPDVPEAERKNALAEMLRFKTFQEELALNDARTTEKMRQSGFREKLLVVFDAFRSRKEPSAAREALRSVMKEMRPEGEAPPKSSEWKLQSEESVAKTAFGNASGNAARPPERTPSRTADPSDPRSYLAEKSEADRRVFREALKALRMKIFDTEEARTLGERFDFARRPELGLRSMRETLRVLHLLQNQKNLDLQQVSTVTGLHGSQLLRLGAFVAAAEKVFGKELSSARENESIDTYTLRMTTLVLREEKSIEF